MGNTNVKVSNESLINVINKELIIVNTKQLQEHTAKSGTIQSIEGLSENGNVVIRDIKMENYVNISLDSYQKTMNKQLLNSVINNSIDRYVNNLVKTQGLTLSNTNKEIINNYKTNVTNDIETKISNEQISKCMASAYSKQEIKGTTKNGNVTIEIIDMKVVSDVSAKCISELIQDIIKQSNTNTNINEQTTTISEQKTDIPGLDIAEKAFGLATYGLYGGLFLCFCLLSLCIIIIIILLVFVLK